MKKVCSKCKVEKDIDDFHKDRHKEDGRVYHCKGCRKLYRKKNKKKISKRNKEWAEKNKDKLIKKRKKYYKENIDKIQKYREKNKEILSNKAKKYYKKNKDRITKYRLKNKEKRKIKYREWEREKRISDPLYKLSNKTRNLIRSSIKNAGYSKTSKTRKILGCSFEKFMNHLNSNKYGFICGEVNIDLDHIIPLASAKSKKGILKLNHYTNFQLLPSDYNRNIKREKPWDQKHFEEWLKKESH